MSNYPGNECYGGKLKALVGKIRANCNYDLGAWASAWLMSKLG